ncbi:MAG: thiamine-phosphate kinase [Pseudomonadales bacterium]
MAEFELIRRIIERLADTTQGRWIRLGPGDDGALTRVPLKQELVSSIDTLVADVHFPHRADAALIGYRAMMVSASDLAAMGASPAFAMLALTLPDSEPRWVERLALGVQDASRALGLPIAGGNLARGPLSISVSVHGHVPHGQALTRSGAQPGDELYVTGTLGAAAAALELGELELCSFGEKLNSLNEHYFRPRARLLVGMALRGIASAAIDVSDGLLQDVAHLCRASNVGVKLHSDAVPTHQESGLQEALLGGDDYELVFSSNRTLPEMDVPICRIGMLTKETDILLDGHPVEISGYDHFEER